MEQGGCEVPLSHFNKKNFFQALTDSARRTSILPFHRNEESRHLMLRLFTRHFHDLVVIFPWVKWTMIV